MKAKDVLVLVLDSIEFLLHVATLSGALLLVGHAVASAITVGGLRPFVSLFVAIVLIAINMFLRLMNSQQASKAK